eukprot:scaffold2868_cov38-Cyclotella_meneghiniana.AAC.6
MVHGILHTTYDTIMMQHIKISMMPTFPGIELNYPLPTPTVLKDVKNAKRFLAKAEAMNGADAMEPETNTKKAIEEATTAENYYLDPFYINSFYLMRKSRSCYGYVQGKQLHANSSGLTQEDLETFTLVPKALVKINPEIKKDCSDFIKTDSTNEEVTICLKSLPRMGASVAKLVESKQAAHENATDHLESLKANRNQMHATHQLMHGIHMMMMMQHKKMNNAHHVISRNRIEYPLPTVLKEVKSAKRFSATVEAMKGADAMAEYAKQKLKSKNCNAKTACDIGSRNQYQNSNQGSYHG